MKKTLFATSFAALLTLLGIPSRASAKAPTVKITVSGGGLRSAIEIPDPRILAGSKVPERL